MPFIAQVCVGGREKLSVFGDDYESPNGTGVRDHIHVEDLVTGHGAAVNKLYSDSCVGCETVNLGTGNGASVLDLVKGMGEATGKPVPYVISPRRPGDVASVYADPSLAKDLLEWKAAKGIKEMCEDTWRWQSTNPMGYKEEAEIVDKV